LDLSSTKDLTALVAVFPDVDGFDVLCECFVPEESIKERSLRDRAPYDQWAREGLLHATPGARVDYEYVRAVIKRWAQEFSVQTIAVDPWNATDLITRLKEQDGFTIFEMRQGFASMSAPSKAFERAILSRELHHNGDPILRWCVSNVSIDEVAGGQDEAGNIKPSKIKSGEKIDAVVALIMAIDQMERHGAIPEPVYQVYGMGR
jgi:phage terminase large subunit-like protein